VIKKFSARAAITVAAVSTVAVLCAPGMASAHSNDGRGKGHDRHHSRLTDVQKACLVDQGITFSKDQVRERDAVAKMKFWAALQTCGIVPTPADPAVAAAKHADAARWFEAAKSANAARWYAAASSGRDHDGSDSRESGDWSSKDRQDGSWRDHDRRDGDRNGWDRGDDDRGSWGHRSSGRGGFGH